MTKVPKEIYAEVERRFACVKPWSEAYHELHSMLNFLWGLDEGLYPMQEIKEEKPKYDNTAFSGKVSGEEYNINMDELYKKALDEIHGVVDVVEVKPFEAKEVLVGDLHGHTRSTRSDRQIETLTKAVLQLQQQVFNK